MGLRRSWPSFIVLLGCGEEAPDAAVQGKLVPLTEVIQIAAGQSHQCALRSGGDVLCWGTNHFGQAGFWPGNVESWVDARQVAGVSDVTSISAGATESCAVRRGGELWCWGSTNWLDPDFIQQETEHGPFRISTGEPVADVAVGYYHTCFRTISGAVKCWGLSTEAQAGVTGRGPCPGLSNSDLCVTTPQTLIESGASALSAGEKHSCAVVDGRVRCWGDEELTVTPTPLEASCTSSSDLCRNQPVTIAGIEGATALASGREHACALTIDRVYCWGRNNYGATGEVRYTFFAEPHAVAIVASSIAATEEYSCGLLKDGRVLCWGRVNPGASSVAGSNPVELDGANGVERIAGGEQRLCAVHDGSVTCWYPETESMPLASGPVLTFEPPLTTSSAGG